MVTTLLGVVGSVVAILLAVAGAIGGLAVFRSTRNAAIITNYKQTAESYRERAESQETEIGVLRATNQTQSRQIAALEGKIAVLEGIASGREAVEELHRHMSDALGAITQQVAEARATVLAEIRVNRDVFRQTRGSGSGRSAEAGG